MSIITDEMIEKAAKGIYEQWVSRDNETRMFAPMWDGLDSSKARWLQDARTVLEAAAPLIAAKALEDAARELVSDGPDQLLYTSAAAAQLRARATELREQQ